MAEPQLPGIEDHPDRSGVFLKLWVLDLLDGDYPVAVLFCQLLWWFQPGLDGKPKITFRRDGETWLMRRDDDWQRDTRLSARQVQRAKAVLVAKGLITVKVYKIAGAPTSAWRPDYDNLSARLEGRLPLPVAAGAEGANPPNGEMDLARARENHGSHAAGGNGFHAPGGNPSSLLEISRDRDLEEPPIAAGAATPAARERDLPFEALCEVCGIDWHELTPNERRRVNAALAQLRAVWKGQDRDLAREIGRRARNYLHAFEVPLTPMALASNWATTAKAPPMGHRPRLTGSDEGLAAAERWLQRQEVRQ